MTTIVNMVWNVKCDNLKGCGHHSSEDTYFLMKVSPVIVPVPVTTGYYRRGRKYEITTIVIPSQKTSPYFLITFSMFSLEIQSTLLKD